LILFAKILRETMANMNGEFRPEIYITILLVPVVLRCDILIFFYTPCSREVLQPEFLALVDKLRAALRHLKEG
jgi:hypothetical protein